MPPRARKLALAFLAASALGTGPGLLLIPLLPGTLLGVPTMYAWLVLWFGIEVLIVSALLSAEGGEV